MNKTIYVNVIDCSDVSMTLPWTYTAERINDRQIALDVITGDNTERGLYVGINVDGGMFAASLNIVDLILPGGETDTIMSVDKE